MSSFDYARTQATATRQIARYGKSAVIRREANSGGNAWDPSSGTISATDYPCKLVESKFELKDINGTTVLQTDRRLLVSVDLAITPTPADLLVIDGQVLRIIDSDPLQPGDTVILYDLQVRL